MLQPFAAKVIVVSDRISRGDREDVSGATLARLLREQGAAEVPVSIIPDEIDQIQSCVRESLADAPDLIILSGGTGLGPRDKTPEAVGPLLDKRLPGVEHALLGSGIQEIASAMFGRPIAGVIGTTVVTCIPGSVGSARSAVATLFPHLKHAFHVIRGGDHDE